MIWSLLFFAASAWFLGYCLRLLYVAWARGYVMALTDPYRDAEETPQTRSANPSKFWANVIITLVLGLPIAFGAVFLSLGWLLAEIKQ